MYTVVLPRPNSNLLLASASVLCALGLFEAALRFTSIRFSDSFYQRDLMLGWKLRPGTTGWFTDEGETLVTINRHGMRDRERSVAKPPGVVRIALLGDSFTEAMHVELDKTFGAVAERQLSRCAAFAGKSPEVLNFGVSHYGTAQEWMWLDQKVWEFAPDWVVLNFFSGNDVYNNHPELNPVQADVTPYFRLREGTLERIGESGGALKRAGFLLRDLAGRAANRSRVASLAAETWLRFARRSGVNAEAIRRFGPQYMDRLAFLEPEGPMLEAWAVTEAILSRVHAGVRAHGSRFLLVSASTAIQVHPSAGRREEFRRQIGAPSLTYPDERLAAFAVREGIPFLALAAPLREEAERTGEFLHGFRKGRAAAPGVGHWNELGHRRAGELAAAKICELAGR